MTSSPLPRRAFLASAAAPLARAARRPPNIVWIMADDMAWGDLGCYGQKIIRTPNLDRLAAQGTRYDNAYAGCTVCAPSRSVLMTGKHMGRTAIRSNPGGVPLPGAEVTVAEVLKKAGYATGCFGKWGLGDIGTGGVPWKHGFDEFFGPLHQVHAHFHYPKFLYDNDREFPLRGNENGDRHTYANDVISDRAVAFVRKNKQRPFFCYAPFTVPHAELAVPADSMAPYRDKIPEKGPYRDPSGHQGPQDYPRACYAGMVSRLDSYAGNLMAALKEEGLERETLVFFTSDNGGMVRSYLKDEFFEHMGPFRGFKTNFYEGGIRTPMIARWPGRIAAGKLSHFPWMFHDFLPTAAELAGVAAPAGVTGRSVLPTLLGKPQQPEPWLYWELPAYRAADGTFAEGAPMQALRMDNWKAVRPKLNAPLELYDLAADVGETRDLAAQRRDIVEKMEAILRDAHVAPQKQTQPAHTWWNSGGDPAKGKPR
jgi:arylsulfatase A-like enzyme